MEYSFIIKKISAFYKNTSYLNHLILNLMWNTMKYENFLFSLCLFLIISTSIFAQDNYYDGTEGLNGDALKSVLHDKIKGHTTSSYSGVWTILKESDRDPNNSNNVILLYSGRSQSRNSNGGNSNDWNREHVWAKSHGGFGTSRPAGTDAHHLRPTDVSVNSSRGNLDFDMGGSPVSEAPDCKRDGDSWEPRDEVKGDVARMMLYMTTRYEGDDTSYDLELVDYTGTSGSKFGKKSVLLEWNRQDPVSAFERNRNRVVYKYQKNYNPFIDHPEYADRIHNSDKLIVESAEQVGNNLVLSFSKELNSTEAENLSNYKLDVLGNPISAIVNFGGDSKKVSLTFSQSFVDTFYNIRVSNLTSTTNEIIIPNSIALFIANKTSHVDTLAPAPPSNLSATDQGSNVELTWNNNTETDLSYYKIYRDTLQNFTISQNTYFATSLSNLYNEVKIIAPRLYYKISALDISGNESIYSNEVSINGAEVDTSAPSMPTNLVANTDGEKVNLSWEANTESDLSHYTIYRGAIPNFTPGQYSVIATSPTNTFVDEEIFDYKVYYRISAFDTNGNESEYSDEVTVVFVGVEDEQNNPSKFSLSQNYPNPFNPSTTISYSIPVETRRGVSLQNVSLKIHNILGKEISTLVNQTQIAGNYSVESDATKLTSGIYFYTLSVGSFKETKSMLLIK